MNAFTRLELVLVLVALSLLAVLLATAMQRAKESSRQVGCIFRLKSVSYAFKAFATDNGGLFPFASTNTPAYQDGTNAWKHFLVLSNEIGSPKNLQCPTDSRRPFCGSFGNDSVGLALLQNQAISYFLNVDAHETNAGMILVGDRNIIVGGKSPTNTGLAVPASARLQWTGELHRNQGNVAFTDGSVQTKLHSAAIWTNQTGSMRLLVP